jgi:hypothetical protein
VSGLPVEVVALIVVLVAAVVGWALWLGRGVEFSWGELMRLRTRAARALPSKQTEIRGTAGKGATFEHVEAHEATGLKSGAPPAGANLTGEVFENASVGRAKIGRIIGTEVSKK